MTTYTLQSFIEGESYHWPNGLTVGLSLTDGSRLLFDFYYNGQSIGEVEVPIPDEPWFVEIYGLERMRNQIVLRIDDSDNLFIPLPDCPGPFTWQFIDLP